MAGCCFYHIFLGCLDAQHTLKKYSQGKKRYLKRFKKGLLHRQSAVFGEKLKLETTNRHDGRCDGYVPHASRNFLNHGHSPETPQAHIMLDFECGQKSELHVCLTTGPDTVLQLARLALRKQSYLQVLQVILLYVLRDVINLEKIVHLAQRPLIAGVLYSNI